MSPIRRYLRITKYSVLEVRIYLDKPSEQPWLLSSRDNVLPRIIEEVRPKVLPKLREENENAKKKGGKKKKGIKDVVSQEDFETLSDEPKLKSNSSKLTGWLNNPDKAIYVDAEEQAPHILEEEDDEVIELQDIPAANVSGKRKARDKGGEQDDDALFVSSSDEDFFQTQKSAQPKRRKRATAQKASSKPEAETYEVNDDKKVCNEYLVRWVQYLRQNPLPRRQEEGQKGPTATTAVAAGGSQMMEQWVSTQAAQEAGLDDFDGG